MATLLELIDSQAIIGRRIYNSLFGWVPKADKPTDGVQLEVGLRSGATVCGYLVNGSCDDWSVQLISTKCGQTCAVRVVLLSIDSVTHV